MKALIKYLAEKKLLIFLLIVLMIVMGVISLLNLNRESYPEISFDMVVVTTIYPGGSPDEIEQLITIPIEKKIREVDGIDKVRSYNIENVSVMAIYLEESNLDKEQTVQDLKDAVESTEDLPDGADKPLVKELNTDKTSVLSFAVQGKSDDVDYMKLRETGKAFEEFLYEFNGVADVTEEGFLDKEFLVEVDPASLIARKLSIDSVISTIRNRNMDIPGGPLRIGRDEMILRTKGQYENINELKNTALLANDEGFGTRIKDVARITETFEEPDVYRRLNGKNTIIYTAWKTLSTDEITLAEAIVPHLNEFNNPYSNEVDVILYDDQSEFTKTQINTVLSNAFTGFILLALILLLFLGPRMSSIVTLTIPLVFLVAFVGMNLTGMTLNVISLFGLIMVLGMIVDFGIVVSENTHRYIEMGETKLEAVTKGISELVLPVTVTFICISAAFLPLLILTGMMGKFIKYIPMAIIICLTASWFVALFFMPAILNSFLKENKKGKKKKGKKKKELHGEELEDGEHLEKGFFGKLQKGYMAVLSKALRFRYITVPLLIVVLILALVIQGLFNGFVFFSGGGAEQITIKTFLPVERNLEYNLEQVKILEKIISKIPEAELENYYSSVGVEETGFLDPRPGDGTNKSTINIYLVPEKDRNRKGQEIFDELRANIDDAVKLGILPEEMIINTQLQDFGPPVGNPVNIEIRGKDYAIIRKIADRYKNYLSQIEGVYDISDDLEDGKEEYRYKINDKIAARTGVSVASIGNVLNASYSGSVATNIKILDEDIDVRVRFKDELRNNAKSTRQVMVSNNRGNLIPLNQVTYLKKQPGYSSINRLNYKRIVQVKAEVDTDIVTPIEVNRSLAKEFKTIEEEYPGYEIAYGGEQEDTQKSMAQLGFLFIIAMFVIFIVLSVFFNSTLIPVVIMSAIPYSIVGVVFALFTHGEKMTFMTMLALFSLAGVIVSNTITLIEFVNLKRKENLPLKKALVEAGGLRLRPVILTTGTTVLGLLPTIYGSLLPKAFGLDKNYMVYPLALAFAYGLIFATVITLIMVPCFYHIAEDLKGLVSRLLARLGIKMNDKLV